MVLFFNFFFFTILKLLVLFKFMMNVFLWCLTQYIGRVYGRWVAGNLQNITVLLLLLHYKLSFGLSNNGWLYMRHFNFSKLTSSNRCLTVHISEQRFDKWIFLCYLRYSLFIARSYYMISSINLCSSLMGLIVSVAFGGFSPHWETLGLVLRDVSMPLVSQINWVRTPARLWLLLEKQSSSWSIRCLIIVVESRCQRRLVVGLIKCYHLMLLHHFLNFACDRNDLSAVQATLLHNMLSHYSLISTGIDDILEGGKCNVFLPQSGRVVG